MDGIVKVSYPSKDVGLLEIKCPYVNAECTNIPQNLAALCLTRQNFYLKLDEDNKKIGINKKHNYYFQVQTQLGVLGMSWCDFMVYYKVENMNICDSLFIRIQFEREFYEAEIIPKLHDFYLQGVVPEVITRRIKKGERLYPNSKKYNYRQINT